MSFYDDMKRQIVDANNAYYNNQTPLMSDAEFDNLRTNFINNYPDDPIAKAIGCAVPGDTPWEKATHKISMGSLNKVQVKESMYDWTSNGRGAGWVLSEKLDGISINLEYEKGTFSCAITRGDGYEGEDITRNVWKMKGFPFQLLNDQTLSARGEIIFEQEDFDNVNKQLELLGEKTYANKRNAASGVAKRQDGAFSEYLTIRFYDVSMSHIKNKSSVFAFLEANHFFTPNWYLCNKATDIQKQYDHYVNVLRDELSYEIDGLVIDLEDGSARSSSGAKDGRPKYAVAYKFPHKETTTQILDVEWSVGSGGHVTPVALLKPVGIGGVTVKRASLHNIEVFKNLHLKHMDTVVVSRRNDVIPYIEKNLGNTKTGTDVDPFNVGTIYIEAPVNCPECDSELIRDGKFLACENRSCKGNELGTLNKWVKYTGMAKHGFGEKTIEKLYDLGYVTKPFHFYTMVTREILLSLDGFGEKSAMNIVNLIKTRTQMSLPDFVGALNIPSFGRRMTSKVVAAGYTNLYDLELLTVQDLVKIDGIGYAMAGKFVDFMRANNGYIAACLGCVNIIEDEPVAVVEGGTLSNQTFCFTGAISKTDADGKRFTRKMMEALVLEHGGEIMNVKKGLAYLVQSDPTSQSSKTKKALNFGVEILSEDNFFKMIGVI
jgi:DNA ligase (NAD+)